jgi:hypothetical protein
MVSKRSSASLDVISQYQFSDHKQTQQEEEERGGRLKISSTKLGYGDHWQLEHEGSVKKRVLTSLAPIALLLHQRVFRMRSQIQQNPIEGIKNQPLTKTAAFLVVTLRLTLA